MKRSNGEGTIYKRKDGRWCACKYVNIGNGKVKRKYVYGKTQKIVKERLKKLDDYEEDIVVAEGTNYSSDMLLRDWMVHWMQQYKKVGLKLTTYENYMLNIRTHIINDPIGKMTLKELTTDMLQQYYNGKFNGKFNGNESKSGLSRRTVEYIRTLIGAALQQAYSNALIEKNVNDFTVLPRKEESEIQPLSLEEVQRVLKSAQNTELYTLLVVEIYTGMRKGEILGLQWENVDLDTKTLYVKKSLCRVENDNPEDTRKTKLILLEPKTKKSVRAIPLSDEAVYALRLQKKKQNLEKMKYRDIYIDQDVVFAKEDGRFRDPRGLLDDFYKILDEAKVKRCRFHDLRYPNPKNIQTFF
ncbi:site-specific integrase [[Clostridium] scindens]|uniref:site-specific integrase n=1 Tax=Clostridium scindens (strain JCM 10418 / VPI 12708) TaxID=29347 RepID=UPI003AB89D73